MSQFDDFLDILSNALATNKVGNVRTKAASQFGGAIATWATTNETTALLMNIKKGAEGLTLIQANHVVVCDSVVDGAMDDQAINRVNRIGQAKETTIHR